MHSMILLHLPTALYHLPLLSPRLMIPHIHYLQTELVTQAYFCYLVWENNATVKPSKMLSFLIVKCLDHDAEEACLLFLVPQILIPHVGQHRRAGQTNLVPNQEVQRAGQRPAQMCCQKNASASNSIHGEEEALTPVTPSRQKMKRWFY